MNRIASSIYERLPVWGQNLVLSGYGMALDRERYGGRFREFQDLLAKTERYSRSDIEAYQDERLRAVVRHAYDTVPYYRRVFDAAKLAPSDIRSKGDLPKVPLLTRDVIRRHFAELRSTALPERSMRVGHTSGTTGTPLSIGYDHDVVWMTYAVFDRHYRWAGCRFGRDGSRVAVARGNVIVPIGRRRPPFWRRNRTHNQLLLSAFHLSAANLPAYVEALRRFQPHVIDGYPSTLYVLAKYLQSTDQKLPVAAAITSSETLYDFQRAVIEERFQCRVFDYYALAERVVFSGECEQHAGHHVSCEYGVAEVIDRDSAPLPAGSPGRLVGTSLHNFAMPLIRYVTNDVSALRPGTCPCGRPLVLMDDVTTKAEDVLTLKDGRLISPSVLTHPFKPLDCIEGSQIVQTEPDRIEVRLVPGPTYTAAVTARLIDELQLRLGADVRIEVQTVSEIRPSANGKFRWVISEVPLGV